MRAIKIAQRFKPYSHLPGVKCLLPGSMLTLQCYPTKIKIFNSANQIGEFLFPHAGPCKEFTAQQDLEKGYVKIWGEGSSGFFRYRCVATSQEPYYSFSQEPLNDIVPIERLALGQDKAQDWDMVKRRQDLCEILPIWLRLAQCIPIPLESIPLENSLLGNCIQNTYTAYADLFRTGFEGLLVPRSTDEDYYGYSLPPIPSGIDPLQILAHSIPFIRQLFCQSDQVKLSLLPHLFQQFHSGRYLHIPTHFGPVDLEWTSHHLRRAELRAEVTQTIHLELPKTIKRFRLKKMNDEQAIWLTHGSPIDITQGYKYCLDRFEK